MKGLAVEERRNSRRNIKKGGEEETKYESMRVGVESTL